MRACFLLLVSATAFAQLPEGQERTAALQKRKELQESIDRHLAKSDYLQGILSLETAVELDKRIHGAAGKPVYFTLEQLAEQYFTVKVYDNEAKVYAEMAPLAAKHFGEKHWRTKTLKLKIERADVLRKLERSDKRFADILTIENRGFQAYNAGKLDDSIEQWTDAISRTERLFTRKSYHYLTNLQMLGLVCYRANLFQRAIETFDELVSLDLELYGDKHPDTLTNRNFLGAVYRKNGQTAKAEPVLLKAVESARSLYEDGELPPSMMFGTLRGVSSFYLEQDDVERMRPFTLEARAFAKKEFGKNSPAYASTLLDAIAMHIASLEVKETETFLKEANDVFPNVYKPLHEEWAMLHLRSAQYSKMCGAYEDARIEVEKALKVHNGLPNRNSTRIYECRNFLGLVLVELSRAEEAVAIFEELAKESGKGYGEKSSMHAAANHNLALAYWQAGSFGKAEKHYKSAIEIKDAIEKDSLDGAISLVGLGGLYLGTQEYSLARSCLERAAQIREKRLGDKHPLVGSSYNELGVLALSESNFRRAEFYLNKAVEIYRATSPNQPMMAKSLDNLAKYHWEVGDGVKAAKLWNEALQIRRKIYPSDSYDLAVGLNNLAGAFRTAYLFDRAETLYRESLGIFEKQKTVPKSDIAVLWHNLAETLGDLKRRDDARVAYENALRAWNEFEKAYPARPPHPQKVNLLASLALARVQENKPKEAEAFSAEAVRIARNAIFGEGTTLAYALMVQSLVLSSIEKQAAAGDAMREVLLIQDRLLNDVLSFTSEQDMLAFASRMQQTFHRIVQAAADNPGDAKTVAFAWELCQRRKGIILDRLCRYRDMERQLARNDALLVQVRTYRGLKKRITEAELNPAVRDSVNDLAALKESADKLQSAINRRLNELIPREEARSDAGAIREQMPAKGCLIEFVRVDVPEYVLGDWNIKETKHYIAFVLPADPQLPMQVFDLDDAEKIERAVKLLRDNLASFPPEQEARYERQFKTSAAALYALLMKPMLPALAGAESLVVIPDGELNRVPFAALVDAEKKYLIESMKISMLPSRRDLFRKAPKEWAEGVAVFANPDYNAKLSEPNDPKDIRQATGYASPQLSGMNWKELPGTAAEARAIEKMLAGSTFGNVATYEGKNARTEAVANLHPPRILHFATHGTYVEKIGNQKESDLRSPGSRQSAASNPMLRSAIILAGANQPPRATGIDGLLTAEEVSLLNLQGTELVVLSACESGLGEVQVGEGVFGLHRAFIHAGAHSLIATLYAVPDAETGKIMAHFYKHLVAKKSLSDALTVAQRDCLRDRRGEDGKGPAHPLYWAAFVLYGNGR